MPVVWWKSNGELSSLAGVREEKGSSPKEVIPNWIREEYCWWRVQKERQQEVRGELQTYCATKNLIPNQEVVRNETGSFHGGAVVNESD